MRRLWCLLALALALLSAPFAAPLQAQDLLRARAYYAVPLYARAAPTSVAVGVLLPQTEVVVEARSPDARLLLVRAADGTRGWAERGRLALPDALDVYALPISFEEMFVPPPAPADYRTIDLFAYPIVPTNLGRAHEIYQRGQALGRDPRVVSKVGDCISDNEHFLSPFGLGRYNLGRYSDLQGVVNHFHASLALTSLAAYNGLVTDAVLDPLFANPLACQEGESPLRCEYRVHNPSVAVIMFGAQDMLFVSAEDFERNLRQIVHESVQAGVVPILSTFPGNLAHWERAVQYNQIVVRVALDYDVPLMNFWRALYALPNRGLNADGRHLSLPLTTSGDLSEANLQRGYPLRNLVTLQALDAVWRGAMQ